MSKVLAVKNHYLAQRWCVAAAGTVAAWAVAGPCSNLLTAVAGLDQRTVMPGVATEPFAERLVKRA
ncbi:MAG: hypothetical protein ACN6OX_08745, partial [Pseudomonas sp.]